MPALEPLSPTYAHARAAFLASAEAAGAALTSYEHPARGREDEDLAIDVAELGAPGAARCVVVVSATHGVEGYCGSALQRHWLDHHADERSDDTRVLLVHAFNPYGFSWVRRVNEDNIDLNRNFIDWSADAPANDEYAKVADLLVPNDWSTATVEATTNELLEHVGQWGMDQFQQIVSGGQFAHPTGIFYGGAEPAWSHRWMRDWAPTALAGASEVVIVDLHTGLGPWGFGELISSVPTTDPQYQRAVQLWGDDVRSMVDGDSVSAALAGDWLAITDELASDAAVTAIAIEYGTVDLVEVLQALRADAVLHASGDPTSSDAAEIRAMVRAAFADDDPEWIEACWPRFHSVMTAALSAS
ncbi:MAG: DUF2817 domain-containing protein [Actinomycetota bacterium]